MIKWYVVEILSEKEFNEVLQILRSAGFRWAFGISPMTYTDFPYIRFLYFGKVESNFRLEWSGCLNQTPNEQLVFKSELQQVIEYLKLSLHESSD